MIATLFNANAADNRYPACLEVSTYGCISDGMGMGLGVTTVVTALTNMVSCCMFVDLSFSHISEHSLRFTDDSVSTEPIPLSFMVHSFKYYGPIIG